MAVLCRDCSHFEPQPGDAFEACPSCGSTRLVEHDELAVLATAHIDCDAFYAAIEKRDRPELRDRPLLIGHAGGRGVVTTACYIARRYGPRSAMPMFKALALCPQAVVLPPDMAKYRAAGHAIRDIFRAATPVIEPVSLDEAYLDLSTEARCDPRPPAVLLAEIARRVESEIGITVSIGLAPNKFLAKLASDRDKPRGYAVIGQGEAAALLAPLPVETINGVGRATAARLRADGFATIGDLQRAPEAALIARHGKFGRRLAGFAQGQDTRAVTPQRPTKSVSTETTFAHDIRDGAALAAALDALCRNLSDRLERAGLAAGGVTLKLKTADFRTLTRSRRLPDPSRRAETLAGVGQALLRIEVDGRAFRLIGIGASELLPADAADPPGLFDIPAGGDRPIDGS